MKNKSETCNLVKPFITMAVTQFEAKIKRLGSDNGSEFRTRELEEFLAEKGIMHQYSFVETPQQNGIAERKHQHILGVTRALMFHSGLPKTFWNFAVAHAIFLINRIPSAFLKDTSPYEVIRHQLPSPI